MNETLFDVLKDMMTAFQDDLHTGLPGYIESFDPATRTASVVPAMKKKYRGGKELAMPVIHGVPVQFPASKAASISFPLVKGDEGLILFSERSIDQWMESGRSSLPEDSRRFSLDDAFFIPGTFSRKNTRSGSKNGLTAEFNKTKLEVLDSQIVMSFGAIRSIKFSEAGMEITSMAGKYSALTHKHLDKEGRPTDPPLPV
jgi:hypothetical protein